MKKLNLFAILAMGMAIVLSSCSNDSTASVDNGGQTDTDEYGYFSLAFADRSSLATRADGDLEYGEPNESKISELRVLLYNTSGALEYAFDYELEMDDADLIGEITSGSTNPPEDYDTDGIVPTVNYGSGNPYSKSEAEYIKIQAYKLLAIVNPTAEIKAKTDLSASASDVRELDVVTELGASVTAGKEYEYFTGAAKDNFLMTNFQEFVDVKATDLKPSKADAEAAPVRVNVDRAVAKVIFAAENDDISNKVDVPNDGATISNLNWKLDITNQNSFMMRHMTYNNSGDMEGPLSSRLSLYAEDVNMDDISYERYAFWGILAPGPIGPGYAENFFNYIGKADVTNEFKLATEEYAFENTMVAEEQYEDVTTAAILKLDYEATQTALYGSTATGVTTAMQEITAGDPYFVWTKDADTTAPQKFIFNAAGLIFIRDITNTNHPVFAAYPDLVRLHDLLKNNVSILEGNAYFGSDYGRSDYTEAVQYTTTSGSDKLAYHFDLTSYYRVLIRHYSNTLQPTGMAWGRYGIVRNNVYKLTLTKVDGPGDIDIPEPKGPDDKFAYLSVQIDVLPWLVREQNVEVR